jgi:putative lipoic acid-binding regulatory protein
MGVDCTRCKNTGKVLNELGAEVLEVVRGVMEKLPTSRVVVKQSSTYSKYRVTEAVNLIYLNIGSELTHSDLRDLVRKGVEVVIR